MKKLLIIVGLVIAVALLLVVGYNTRNYSKGSRAGTIVKLSKKGTLFRTWEGQLNAGLVILDDAAASGAPQNSIWDFSVQNNDTLIKKMEVYMAKGTRVLLRYEQKYSKLPWRGETEYIIVGVEDYK